MDFRKTKTDYNSLKKYVDLFSACFPESKHFSVDYLKWLYVNNPDGAVIGFDAWDEDNLAAQYVCVPVAALIHGKPATGLLSLNTATHPAYQGKGLFTTLATHTYEHAREQGYSFVYGIANANSTPGFIRKLGFALVQPLEARIGIGDLLRDQEEQQTLTETAAFRRTWTPEARAWRLGNPANAVHHSGGNGRRTRFCASTGHFGIQSYWEEFIDSGLESSTTATPVGLRLFLGLLPRSGWRNRRYVAIPDRLKPSPLNLIFRDIGGIHGNLRQNEAMISFLDFDAY